MRRLTLPSRRFRPTKSFLISSSILSAASAAVFFGSSCRERAETDESGIASIETSYESIKLASTPIGKTPGVPYASFNSEACSDPSAEELWNLSFSSDLGGHTAKVRLSKSSQGTASTLTIDTQVMTLTKSPESLAAAKAEICEAYAAGKQDAYDLRSVNSKVQTFLSAVAPSCRFSWENHGLFCKLTQSNAGSLERELGDIQTHMLRRWTRQPYLITRRLAITKGLASLVSSGQFSNKRTDYCRIIESSLPEELPVSMRTSRWQKAVCYGSVEAAKNVANLGIVEALAEIRALKEQVEQNSKQGLLTVKIPPPVAPSKDFWVTLSPVLDKPEADQANATQLQSFCWHPLYQENDGFLYLGRVLHLIADSTECATPSLSSLKPERQIANYIIDSITSETEFPITNGRSKLLSLPYGNYEYSIQPYSPALEPWEAPDPAMVKTGTITWDKTRSKAEIIAW
jgi:hypothetical protein